MSMVNSHCGSEVHRVSQYRFVVGDPCEQQSGTLPQQHTMIRAVRFAYTNSHCANGRRMDLTRSPNTRHPFTHYPTTSRIFLLPRTGNVHKMANRLLPDISTARLTAHGYSAAPSATRKSCR